MRASEQARGMHYPVDERLYQRLAELNPEEVVLEPYVRFQKDSKTYLVSTWGRRYAVSAAKQEIVPLARGEECHDFFAIFLINYLLSEKRRQPAGRWISEKDLVGGPTFFRGPHAIPTESIVNRYGDDAAMLDKTREQMGGTPLEMADIAFSVDVIASIRIALLYWMSDDDFPAEARLLVDESVAGTLELDVVYALLCDACFRLARGVHHR